MSFFKSSFFTNFFAALIGFTVFRFSHLATPSFNSKVTTPTKWDVKASINGFTVASNGTAEEIREELQKLVPPPYQNVTGHLANQLRTGGLRPSAKQFDDIQSFRSDRLPECFVQMFCSSRQEETIVSLRNVLGKPIDDNNGPWFGERETFRRRPKVVAWLSHDDGVQSRALRKWTHDAASDLTAGAAAASFAPDDNASLVLDNCAVNLSVSESFEPIVVSGRWEFTRRKGNGQFEFSSGVDRLWEY